jgi:hypothetical protein
LRVRFEPLRRNSVVTRVRHSRERPMWAQLIPAQLIPAPLILAPLILT